MWMDWLKRTLKTRDREIGSMCPDKRRDPGAVTSSPVFSDSEAVVPRADPPDRELEPAIDRGDGERWG